MAAKCPNRKRTKRLANGRGKIGCQGTLQLTTMVPLAFPVNRWPKMLDGLEVFAKALYGPVRKYGRRVLPRDLLEALKTGRWNLSCSTCGWILKEPTKARGC